MHIPISAAPVGALLTLTEAQPISLPLRKEYVPLILDGQSLNFRADSGSARSFAIYGPSYEALKGEGSCGRTRSGCYFCPTDNPCGDILSRKRWNVKFADGHQFEYVEHNVTLVIPNKTVPNFKIGLAVAYSNIHGTDAWVFGLLGLSIARTNIPETFLEQLKRRQVISSLVYSCHAEERGPCISGNLTLDDSGITEVPPVSFRGHSSQIKKITVPLLPLTLIDPYGNRWKQKKRYASIAVNRKTVAGYVDTGATFIDVSNKEFEGIVNLTVSTMHQNQHELNLQSRDELVWKDPKTRFYMVRREAVPYLPTLAYYVGDPTHQIEIRIQPKHLGSGCDLRSCQFDISPSPDGNIYLGHPLFRAYDVKFDLSNYLIYFSPHRSNAASVGQAQDAEPGTSKLPLVGPQAK
ncbi:hypothetical protein FOZ62_016673 [Perkinsus olseni]|uniref:Peptidase A1 domain-containing protein n=1 Tax=Perkinsus olseni TaxID=32597 RepID=A0A7J6SZT6_PEROL|nr:hypothetical protein FOZ62_016673 [Perkinsus olseni]